MIFSLSLRKVWKTAWKRFWIIACVLHSRTVIILRFLKPCTDKTHFKGVLVSGHSLMKLTKVIELPNDGWSWNGKLVSDIGHRSFFNWFLSNDSTLNGVFKENSSRHASRFRGRNLRRFLKIIFLQWFPCGGSILIISTLLMLGSLMSSRFVIKCNDSIRFFLMMVWSLFIIGHMGLFFYNKIGSIISIGDLPTTNIIESANNTPWLEDSSNHGVFSL